MTSLPSSSLLAGEATDYDYNGFVAGGFTSGANVANMVEAALRADGVESSWARGSTPPEKGR